MSNAKKEEAVQRSTADGAHDHSIYDRVGGADTEDAMTVIPPGHVEEPNYLFSKEPTASVAQ